VSTNGGALHAIAECAVGEKSLIWIAHFSGSHPKRVGRIDHVLLVVNGKHPSAVHLHFNRRLVPARKPKTINSLILPDKVSSIDQKDGFLAGWPAILTIAKSSASIHIFPSNRYFSSRSERHREQSNDTGRDPPPRLA